MRAVTARPSRAPARSGWRRDHAQRPAATSATPKTSADTSGAMTSIGLAATIAASPACRGRVAAVR